jgi:hypothetical protein
MGSRIKTEAEFIREFGKNWYVKACGPVDWNVSEMGHLFGRTLSKEASDLIKNKGCALGLEEWGGRWRVDSNMVVFSPDATVDMDLFSSWPPVEGHAKWWSELSSTAH